MSPDALLLWLLPVLVFAASAVLTGVVLRWLRRAAVLDRPGPRSSHAVPTPRGGGIAVLGVLLPAWAAVALLGGDPSVAGQLWPVLAAGLLLAIVSWIDDLRGLSPAWRLPVHVLAVAVGVFAAGDDPVFQGLLPDWLDALAAGLLWLWFMNLFNFMDGIDGIAGVEAASIGIGLALVALIGGLGAAALPIAGFGLTLASAAAGFLLWNRPPARLFLGDVGSIPLGFLMGWLLLEAARAGAWAAALILPAYFLVDATWTLAARLARGISPLEPHAEHFYQRAVREVGRSHGQVVAGVLLANLALIGFAVGAEREDEQVMALVGAAAVVALLIRRLMRRRSVK
jgi:UDP-N-acetylmuramyl pentapeptide phosphotransferase/UDP-N-acetylglucosamine-1-phosphate transferase